MEPEIDQATSTLSLNEYWQILKRRRTIVVQAFVVIASVGIILTMMTRPVYQGKARLLIEAQSNALNTVDTTNPLSSILALSQPQSVSTQVELLQQKPILDSVAKLVPADAVTINEVKDTNLIEVTAESPDPDIAGSVPNTILETYLSQDVNSQLNEIQTAEAFVKDEGAAAHQQLIASDNAIAQFKEEHHISDFTLDRQNRMVEVGDLETRAGRAVSDYQALLSQIATTRQLLASESPTLTEYLATTNTERAGLEAQLHQAQDDLKADSGPGQDAPGSPKNLAFQARVAEIQSQLNATPTVVNNVNSTLNPTRQSLLGALATEQAQASSLATQSQVLQTALNQAEAGLGKFAEWEVTLSNLNRLHDAADAANTMFTNKLADLQMRERAQHATAHISERSVRPSDPVRPKKLLCVIFSCLVGLFVGLCLGLLQEYLDDRINSTDDGVRYLDLPSLGIVPALTASDARLLPKMKGLDPAAESYRVLRTNIHFAAVDAPVRTLLVTSSNPGEGKSTTATNLAFAMALDGKQVILVDTDLRRPSIHKLLGYPSTPGVTDVLLGHSDLDEALVINQDLPNLKTLTAGSTPPNPSELLNSRTFRNLVGDMTNRADIVIFDSPPALITADSAILASQLDGTVIVIETGQTKKAAVRRSIQLLRQARANVLGAAYNKARVQDGEYYYYQYRYSTPAAEHTNGTKGHLDGQDEDQTNLITSSKEG